MKDLVHLPKKLRSKVEVFAFETLPQCKSLIELKGVTKLSGHDVYYRVRIGDYRIGLRFQEDIIYMERVGHRGRFYKEYPPKM